jgi:AcrR family transcriptional regulator
MLRRPETDLRLLPQQERAELQIECIVEAARRMLRDGADVLTFTTSAVADRSGVGVGTLYRYFADREALVSELLRRVARHDCDQLAALMDACHALPLRETITLVVTTMFESCAANARLYRLAASLPRLVVKRKSQEDLARFTLILESGLAARKDPVKVGASGTSLQMLVQAMDGLVERTLEEQPERLTDPAFVVDAVNLCEAVLAPT